MSNKALIPSLVLACGLAWGGPLQLSGFLRNETALSLHDPDCLTKVRNVAQLEADWRISDAWSAFVSLRGFYDAAYEVEDHWRPHRDRLARPERAIDWLRECYLQYTSERWDLRLGKQQVVWGTADATKVLDLVNPYDQREFNLPDWADSRIPLWMLRAEYSPTVDSALQLLFIPDFEPHYYAPVGSPFYYRKFERFERLRAQGFRVDIDADHPAQTFRNARVGLRWLDVRGGWQYTLNFLHGPSTTPGYYLKGMSAPRTFRFLRQYEPVEIVGGSFAKTFTAGPLQGITFKGEMAWVHNQPASTTAGRTVDIDQFNYVLGLEKYVVTNWLVSAQFFQFINSPGEYRGHRFTNPAGGPQDQVENMLSLKVATDFLHERLKPEVMVVYEDDGGWWVRPRAFYEINDRVTARFGLNLFAGRSDRLLGEFHRDDQAFVEVRYGF